MVGLKSQRLSLHVHLLRAYGMKFALFRVTCTRQHLTLTMHAIEGTFRQSLDVMFCGITTQHKRPPLSIRAGAGNEVHLRAVLQHYVI